MKFLFLHAPGEIVREMCLRGHMVQSVNGTYVIDSGEHANGSASIQIAGRKKLNLRAIRAIRRLVREFQPDVIHAFMPHALAWVNLSMIGIRHRPKIVSFRGITRVPSRWDPADRITFLSRKVDFHACESHAVMQSMLAARITPNKCSVVYNCVEQPERAEAREAWLERWGVPCNAFVVGTVATIRKVKGIDVLIRAAIECRSLPNVHFVIVGPGDDAEVMQLAADERLKGRVHLVGPVWGAGKLMHAFDVFPMPSRKEGLCRALIEAMQQSVAPVVSDAGGMKELVRDGVDGIVFPSEDVGALAHAIQKLYHDPSLRTAMGRSSSARASEMCSPIVVCDRLMTIYEKLIRA